jgi:hypothetical protein
MNRIILIGNGFDLAHGLKTSYADFINAFWMDKIQRLVANRYLGYFEDKDIVIYPINCGLPELNRDRFSTTAFQIENKISQWKEKGWILDKIKAILEEHKVVIEYKNRFLEIISKEVEGKKWVDIEEEYYKQMVLLLKNPMMVEEEVSQKIEELNKDFERVKKALEEYLERVLDPKVMPDECIKPNDYIKQNIYSIIEPKEVMSIGKDAIKTRKNLSRSQRDDARPVNILFLNFNYTPTEKRYLDNGSTSEILHIHGELDNPDNPIIFGYGDELDDMYPAIEKTNDNRFLENVKSIRYLETDNYKQLLNFVEFDFYQVCVFGHSCGISDRTLLNTLFEHKNCISIKVFYHQKEDGTDNYSDVVRNISRNFTDKAAMRDKVVNKKYCKPLKGESQQE